MHRGEQAPGGDEVKIRAMLRAWFQGPEECVPRANELAAGRRWPEDRRREPVFASVTACSHEFIVGRYRNDSGREIAAGTPVVAAGENQASAYVRQAMMLSQRAGARRTGRLTGVTA